MSPASHAFLEPLPRRGQPPPPSPDSWSRVSVASLSALLTFPSSAPDTPAGLWCPGHERVHGALWPFWRGMLRRWGLKTESRQGVNLLRMVCNPERTKKRGVQEKPCAFVRECEGLSGLCFWHILKHSLLSRTHLGPAAGV